MVITLERSAKVEEETRPTQRAKAMVIGSGGREHALVWKLQRELGDNNVLFVPGNGGVPDRLRRDIKAAESDKLYRLAKEERIDLTVVGPEQPLADGIVDYFSFHGLPIFGPTKDGARIESSKIRAKRFMAAHRIPTAEFVVPDSDEDVYRFGKQFLDTDGAVVLKADGLAGGKGSVVCKSESALRDAIPYAQGLKAGRIFAERFLPGEEVSYIVVTDGYDILPLLATQDHKAAYDGDEGPNTGGMGAYTRPKIVTARLEAQMREIMLKAVRGMLDEGKIYKGVLYGGFMIVNGQPYVLEFNCRFGDPETQPLMALMDSSLVDVIYAAMENRLGRSQMKWKPDEALTAVIATKGYPDEKEYIKYLGQTIQGLGRDHPDVIVFHAGTARRDEQIVNSGGRVLGVTGVGPTLAIAKERAYSAVGSSGISFDMHFRRDIGYRSLR